MPSVQIVLLALALASGHGDVANNDACQDASSSLCSRIDRLERMLAGQMQQHNEAVSSLETKLLDQDAKLSQQVEINRQQASDLSRRDDVIQQQAERLSRQERTIQRLAEVVGELEGNRARVVRQYRDHDMVGTMEGPEEKDSPARQSADLKPSDLSSESDDALIRPDDEGLLVFHDTLTRSDDGGRLVFHDELTGSDDGGRLVFHDVLTRSDDAGPLEAVVYHVSQKVTQLTADLQATKTQTSADIQALQNSLLQQGQGIAEARTSTYVHWGSAGCGNASQVVYTGVVGGELDTHTGAATNYLCLSMSPVASHHAVPTHYSYLYGAEYQTYDSHENMDPVCAVCRSGHPNSVMIPGTNVCTPGWHVMYSGYLMSGFYSHSAGSEFICVDTRLESRAGSDADVDGKLMYFVVTQCGSLPCEPYVNNKVVACVVCSQ